MALPTRRVEEVAGAPAGMAGAPATSREHQPLPTGAMEEPTPRVDNHMARQSAYFGNTTLERAVELAGPRAISGREQRNFENDFALGGMRRPDKSVATRPQYAEVGKAMRSVLDALVEKFPEVLQLVQDMRVGKQVTGFSDVVLQAARQQLLVTLGSEHEPCGRGPEVELFRAWGRAVGDVDCAKWLPLWLEEGAPMGITREVPLAGVFPKVDPGKPTDPNELRTEWMGWTNYISAEAEPEVVLGLLEKQRSKGHCEFFQTKEAMAAFVETDEVVLSKLALITKLRPDGSCKDRLIWDLLRSEVNNAAALGERIVLPRIQDAVEDALGVAALQQGELEWMVLDVEDAFHNIPIFPSERKFACCKVQDTFVVFRVLCMGGKASPTIWGRFAAAMGRFVSSILQGDPCRLEIYVDDPIFVAAGSALERARMFAVAALALAALGFPLSWGKAAMGPTVTWIGAQLAWVPEGVLVEVPEAKLAEILEAIEDIQRNPIVRKKALQAFCGKVGFLAGFIVPLRPFLAMLWAAMFSTQSKLPRGMLHSRRIQVPLQWLRALLRNQWGPLRRTFPWQPAWAPEGDYLATDACPWGFAGVRFQANRPAEWFACELSSDDLRRFQAKRGESGFTTLWEALALLVAFRVWLPNTRALARVRSDSLGALRAMVKFSSSSVHLNMVSRELALDAVLGLYSIGLASHIPGVSNVLPDHLSRLWAPDAHQFPLELQGVPEVKVPLRDATFWKSAGPTQRGGRVAAKRKENRGKRDFGGVDVGVGDDSDSSAVWGKEAAELP